MPRQYTPRVATTCERCGVTTLKAPSAIAAGRGRFCSRTCKDAAQENRDSLACETCGKPLDRKRSAVRGVHNFCSVACRVSAPPAPAILSDDGLTARLPLQDNYGEITGYALIDAAGVGWAQQWRWQMSRRRRVTRGEKGATIYLHREFMGLPRKTDGREIDHVNRDTLDNRRVNLRVVTRGQNAQNLSLRVDSTSGHRGVSWSERMGQWAAYISVGRKQRHLGFFLTKEEAAAAAREARQRLMTHSTD